MANTIDPVGQFAPNIIEEVIKAFGDVPVSLTTLIDLGTNYIYTHFLIVNSLDKDIIIKFEDKEITFLSAKDITMDNFRFNGIIKYKYKSSAPTAGSLQIICY